MNTVSLLREYFINNIVMKLISARMEGVFVGEKLRDFPLFNNKLLLYIFRYNIVRSKRKEAPIKAQVCVCDCCQSTDIRLNVQTSLQVSVDH